MKRRRARLWVWILALSLVSCTAGRSVRLFPQGTQPVIKIGLVAPFEGRYRALGYEVLYAAKWAVRERNDAGGVAGYLVDLVALNDDDDPTSSAFQAEKLAVDQSVMGVVGHFSVAALSAAAPVYHERGLAVVTLTTCPLSLLSEGYGELFCLAGTTGHVAEALIDRLPDGARVTLLRAEAGPLGERLSPLASEIVQGPWTEDVLRRLANGEADLYLYEGDVLAAAELTAELRERGDWRPVWGGPSLARVQLPQIAGESARGVCYVLADPLLADPEPDSGFSEGYEGLAGGEPGRWAALAYDAVAILLDALEDAIDREGRPTRANVIRQVAGARTPDGDLMFDAGQRRQVTYSMSCYGADVAVR